MGGMIRFFESMFTPGQAKYALIAAASSGDNELVAAKAGYKIRVLAYVVVMTGTAVTIRFESGAGGTALTGQMTPTQGSKIEAAFCPVGHFETAVGAALNLELGGAQAAAGHVVYCFVPGDALKQSL